MCMKKKLFKRVIGRIINNKKWRNGRFCLFFVYMGNFHYIYLTEIKSIKESKTMYSTSPQYMSPVYSKSMASHLTTFY